LNGRNELLAKTNAKRQRRAICKVIYPLWLEDDDAEGPLGSARLAIILLFQKYEVGGRE